MSFGGLSPHSFTYIDNCTLSVYPWLYKAKFGTFRLDNTVKVDQNIRK